MAAPNVVNVATITGKTKGVALTTTLTADILENPASSGKVFKVDFLVVANIDGTSAAELTLDFYDASATTSYNIANTISVPADGSLDVIAKPLWLEEGDKITGGASANGDLELVVSWTEISQ